MNQVDDIPITKIRAHYFGVFILNRNTKWYYLLYDKANAVSTEQKRYREEINVREGAEIKMVMLKKCESENISNIMDNSFTKCFHRALGVG